MNLDRIRRGAITVLCGLLILFDSAWIRLLAFQGSGPSRAFTALIPHIAELLLLAGYLILVWRLKFRPGLITIVLLLLRVGCSPIFIGWFSIAAAFYTIPLLAIGIGIDAWLHWQRVTRREPLP